jgi:hypothetical protein
VSFRRGDPDSNLEYFRQLEDRITALEQKATDQSRQSTREIRLRSAKKLTSLMVIGDSLAQFDRCNRYDNQKRVWQKSTASQLRWQDQLSRSLAGISGVRQFLPTTIGPFAPSSPFDLASGPVVETVGSGAFTHWDYAIPGSYASWFVRNGFESGYYPPSRVPVDLLVVALGTNDFLTGQTPDSMKAAMGRILTEYLHRFACVLVPWQPQVGGAYPWSSYTSALQSLASSTVRVIEAHPGSGPAPRSYVYDGIHLTQAGHDAIYDQLIEVTGTLTKASSSKNLLTGSAFGVSVTEGIVIGNWRISVTGNGELIATNLRTNKDTVLGV